MKRFENLNFYELLEIPFDASSFEIRQAYRSALSIYEEDSIISDAFFTDEERSSILRKIEEAFSTLIDRAQRLAYNRELADAGAIDAALLEKSKLRKDAPIPLFSLKKKGGRPNVSTRVKARINGGNFAEISKQITSKNEISGDDLKRLRKRAGIALDEIFEVTRISVKVLTAIENDDVKRLPQKFYLKNFLKAYAELFNLDSGRLIDGYLENISQKKP